MPGNIWNKPAVPHALDDEFESTTLDPSWDINTTDFVTPVDPYAVVSPARVKIHTDLRPSWLTSQGSFVASKAYTLPTNCLIWARLAPGTTTATRVNGDSYCGIYFSATSGGLLDGTNAVRLFLRSFTSTNSVELSKAQFAAFSEVATIPDVSTRGLSYEYVCLHKIGGVFHAWAITSGGVRTYVGWTTYTGAALDRVAIVMPGNETVPGSPIQGIDFFRVVESATYLP